MEELAVACAKSAREGRGGPPPPAIPCRVRTSLKALPDFLRQAQSAGVDAFYNCRSRCYEDGREIRAKRSAPCKYQLGVINSATANVLYDMGAKAALFLLVKHRCAIYTKFVQIRRKSLKLKRLSTALMCVSFSGRCLLSNYLTGRDANRGACAQPLPLSIILLRKSARVSILTLPRIKAPIS